jgi:hypothetical protein
MGYVTIFLKWGLSPFLVLMASCALAQECRVLDPELQASYAGPCVNGLAEGVGNAIGTAEYRGEFKAGGKHGKGVKTWANGDRYEGDFVEDRIEGFGLYVFGRGPWQGERYEGDYLAGRRHGHGVYRWTTGDVYSGPWRDDRAVGSATPMMLALAKFQQEAHAAVARQGQKVCRELPVGIAGRDWVRGVVVAVQDDKVAVRLDELGSGSNALAAVAKKGEIIWDTPLGWTPCY